MSVEQWALCWTDEQTNEQTNDPQTSSLARAQLLWDTAQTGKCAE